MADKPPGKPAASSRDPRLVYRPIVPTTPIATTSTSTPPTAGGTPLVPAGYVYPERGERGPRQVGGKSGRSSSEDEEQKPSKRLDTASTPSPSDPEEGGGEEMASTSATSATEESGSESSTSSADTTPSRSTSYVELENLANVGKAAATNTQEKDTSAAAGSIGAAADGRRPHSRRRQRTPSSPQLRQKYHRRGGEGQHWQFRPMTPPTDTPPCRNARSDTGRGASIADARQSPHRRRGRDRATPKRPPHARTALIAGKKCHQQRRRLYTDNSPKSHRSRMAVNQEGTPGDNRGRSWLLGRLHQHSQNSSHFKFNHCRKGSHAARQGAPPLLPHQPSLTLL
ncbi:hypothetical protein K1T71_014551 [Dendrolimus kikuchii]|uniref:Uncharacterized protein n=1 Tax=Dendrolimus kikuchii TaxID=765133 RepID=A0ACC1CEN5_9NEOP|nr:hypothetical protein K1T71_014551 [Dendrolimus kikuchii]